MPYVAQTWSVGVEEQFYLIWPLLVKMVRNTLLMLCLVICVYFTIRIITAHLAQNAEAKSTVGAFNDFWYNFSIDCMAIGGIFAFALHKAKKNYLNFFFHKVTQIIVYLLTIILIVTGTHFPYLHYETYALLFAIMIVNLAGNPDTILNIENKAFNYLGKISYGLYMFHPVAIVLCLLAAGYLNTSNPILIYASVLVLTIIIAGLSYSLFEKRFLKLKPAFSVILSGEKAASE